MSLNKTKSCNLFVIFVGCSITLGRCIDLVGKVWPEIGLDFRNKIGPCLNPFHVPTKTVSISGFICYDLIHMEIQDTVYDYSLLHVIITKTVAEHVP